jgi:hypothetical protein
VKCEHTCLIFSSCKNKSIGCFGERNLNYLNTLIYTVILASSNWIHLHIKLIKTHGRVLKLSEIKSKTLRHLIYELSHLYVNQH